jgi:hypothetical protein
MAMNNDNDLEYWLFIKGSIKYQCSNLGRFRRVNKKGIYFYLTPFIKKTGNNHSLIIKVEIDGIYRTIFAHKVIASLFLEEQPAPGMVIYHKNKMKYDNNANNLAWIDRRSLGLLSGGKTTMCKPVLKIDIETGETLDFYKSIRTAAKENYINRTSICNVLNGIQKIAGGYGWRKETEYDKY